MGLMPHPEHAVDDLTGSADGGLLFESLARQTVARVSTASPHRELGLTDAEYELICQKMGRDPNGLELAVFSLMWSEHCAYKHSKKLLREPAGRGPAPADGPGRERRRGGRGRRRGHRVQGRVAQPPVRGRAVPGRGHGRRRHPARRVRGGRAAHRHPRLAALRRAGVAAVAVPAGRRRLGHRPLRQLDRRAHHRRRGLLRGRVRVQLPGQRHVPGHRRPRPADPLAPRRAWATCWC